MVKQQLKRIYVDAEDVRLARGIASFKGMTMQNYFSEMITKESREFQETLKLRPEIYRRRK